MTFDNDLLGINGYQPQFHGIHTTGKYEHKIIVRVVFAIYFAKFYIVDLPSTTTS